MCAVYTRLKHSRKPSNESFLLGFTLGTLESEPVFVENLHIPRILHPHDTLAQLLSVGGPWCQSKTKAVWPEHLVNLDQLAVSSNLIVNSCRLHYVDIAPSVGEHLVNSIVVRDDHVFRVFLRKDVTVIFGSAFSITKTFIRDVVTCIFAQIFWKRGSGDFLKAAAVEPLS